jgi:hypothetical protein
MAGYAAVLLPTHEDIVFENVLKSEYVEHTDICEPKEQRVAGRWAGRSALGCIKDLQLVLTDFQLYPVRRS